MPTNFMRQPVLRYAVALALAAGCGGAENGGPDAATMCNPNASAPTYTQLYTRYFAPNTPGHCANEMCHGDIEFNIWKCGLTKDTCFNGMVGFQLIDTANPLASRLASSTASPLIWISPNNGFMPADALTPFPEGRDAILAWIGACAPNN